MFKRYSFMNIFIIAVFGTDFNCFLTVDTCDPPFL